MKRLAFLSVVVLLVGVIPFAMHAKPKDDKIDICHFDEDGVGHPINVSPNARNAHIGHHDGDCETFVENAADGTCACDDDGDGVANADDICPGSDDTLDADTDGVPDGCDLCPGANDADDADADGVPDACDICPGGNDADDADDDGVPDACDLCPDDPDLTCTTP